MRRAVLLGCLASCVAPLAPLPTTAATALAVLESPPAPVLPPPTVKAEPCQTEEFTRCYLSGRWNDGELLAQRCLQTNPLATVARVVLVRMYLMRAYAAHESRWLDEARRQLKMVAADPDFADEANELALLVEQPIVE